MRIVYFICLCCHIKSIRTLLQCIFDSVIQRSIKHDTKRTGISYVDRTDKAENLIFLQRLLVLFYLELLVLTIERDHFQAASRSRTHRQLSPFGKLTVTTHI